MAAPSGGMTGDKMASPMANDTMKMDHKKPMKKTAMKHDAMGMAAPQNGMAAPQSGMAGGMASGNSGGMSGPSH
jgi:hypothetical protein